MAVSTIEAAIAAIARGEPVVVVDDADRENEGDLIIAAEKATAESLAFMIRHTSGVVCVALTAARLAALELPLMVADNGDAMGTAFTVTVDLRHGTTTGISAADRAATIRALASPSARADEFARPGHVFPLRARDGGVLRRPGHTEAAVDLARLAGLAPAGALCELVNPDGSMARLPELEEFARRHRLVLVTVADLIAYRRRTERLVERVAEARLPTRHGPFTAHVYRSIHDGREHVALVMGEVRDHDDVLVRVHSECVTGDVFGSTRCDCGAQLDAALAQVGAARRGVVVYLRDHEGRGVGLTSKLHAYQLQDAGRDTVEANLELGLPVDSRRYDVGAQILTDLGLTTIRLMSNNPAKFAALAGYALRIVERVPLVTTPTGDNTEYLRTKQRKLGHLALVPERP
ncbi:MAG TPA: bifunctional 3,4-dihydroxy-2-butanone-4-phosphate synthase/GTP cyclohydrolase II [Kofleriaceae bacterium]|nr:bifunctional 3,4-dihydroxy-2-butanone-4-phosphate synthase/GTP cyclohydrolase II [Kofleriaceae bacterium]